MMPATVLSSDIPSLLPKGGRVLVGGASGESLVIAEMVMAAGASIGPMIFTGALIPGTNHHTYLANAECRLETFFITPEIKAAPPSQIDFLPLCYNDILRRLSTIQIDACFLMVAPPDAQGNCSFGPAVDFLAELWPRIPLRIAHINPLMPRTGGLQGIPYSEISAAFEADQPLGQPVDPREDPIANAIAAHIAPFVPNGATLQLGIGKVPGAVMKALTGRRNLRFHSGLIVDEVVDLEEAGALAPGVSVLAGVAIGSDRLYQAIGRPAYEFQPASVTHNEQIIGSIPNFISINSALEVDLFGQVYSELTPKGFMSGPGGASDYARGVRLSPGGLRIIALASSAAKGSISRIVLHGAGPVSLGRMDVDLFVTEHGVADMRNKGYAARAQALIAIAPESHRDDLGAAWAEYSKRFGR